MQLDDFNKITEEAKRKFDNYLRLDKRATHVIRELHKEDFLSYWIAVEAYDKGKADGIVDGI